MIYDIICHYSNEKEIQNASALDVIYRLRRYIEDLTSERIGVMFYPTYGMDHLTMNLICASVLNGVHKSSSEFKNLMYDSNGNVCGIETKAGEKIYSKSVICSAHFVPEMVEKESSVIYLT